MRIDHFAYQRATRVASVGLLLQIFMGVFLLVFGVRSGDGGDTAILFGSIYVLVGSLVWVSLIILFHQHKLERLEALEEDELAAAREGTSSIFDASSEEIRVAARRLRLMHHWMMPAVSLGLALLLLYLGPWWMLGKLAMFKATGAAAVEAAVFERTSALGWAVAICLALAAISFIFSRFVAGMSQQKAWQNLRGGAGFMVGNSLVLFAIAAGVVFRFFEKPEVIEYIAYAIAIFMGLLAVETLLNLVLNFYRPRIPGETPRPAFDSRILSILAAPDSLVRSINEAVNYQFGFDLTSTWGYKLLVRSLLKLFALGVVVLLAMSTVVWVEPYQQAVRLRGGRIAGDVAGSGLLLKLPWPLQSATVHDVARVRPLNLTAILVNRGPDAQIPPWHRGLDKATDGELEPFLVRRSTLDLKRDVDGGSLVGGPDADPVPAEEAVSLGYALIDAEVILQYRIREDANGQGLLDYLNFAPDEKIKRDRFTVREKILRSIALRAVSLHFSTMTLDEAVARRRGDLSSVLSARVQKAFDDVKAGIEVVGVEVPLVRPAGAAAEDFEDLMMARESAGTEVARAEAIEVRTLTYLVGDLEKASEVLSEIERYNQLSDEHGNTGHPDLLAQRDKVDRLLLETGGTSGQEIARAETDRWLHLVSARSQASQVQGQLAAYRAAPELYKQRELMRTLASIVGDKPKYIIGVEPGAVQLNIELSETDPYLTQFNTASNESESDQ